MAWTQVIDDTFTRANTSTGASGSTTGAGNGWIDDAGGVWQISGNTLLGTSSYQGGFLTQVLQRPSGESATGSRITSKITAPFTGECGAILRNNGNSYYLADLSPGNSSGYQIAIYLNNSGTVSRLTQANLSTALVTGHQYLFDFYASGTSPTNLSLHITDITTSSLIGTISTTDSTSGLQASGVPGLVTWSGTGSTDTVNIQEATTYTGSAPASSITPSPSTLTAGTTSQSVTVAGTGTSFTGTPFTITGGYGASIVSQSVSSGTAGTVSINPGVVGFGNLTLTDTISGDTATITVATPSLGPLKIGWIGDSITSGTNGAPVTAAAAFLTGLGYTVTSNNQGVSATTTYDWRPGGSYLPGAISAFQTAGVTIVHVMLGTNDVRTPNSFSTATHFAQMSAIVGALKTAGFQVVISKPLWTLPNTAPSGSVWPADPNGMYLAYYKADLALVDGSTVFMGETGAYEVSQMAPQTWLASADGVHSRQRHPKQPAWSDVGGGYSPAARWRRFGKSLVALIGLEG